MPFISTTKTCSLMNANHFTTVRANPFRFLITNEISDPKFVYHFEILDHTHSVLVSVSLIQVFQPGAGKLAATAGTILYLTFGELVAVFNFTRGPAL